MHAVKRVGKTKKDSGDLAAASASAASTALTAQCEHTHRDTPAALLGSLTMRKCALRSSYVMSAGYTPAVG